MKIFISFLIASLFISPPNHLEQAIESLDISSENYILYSTNTDKVIASKNENLVIEAASLNKVLTIITAIDMLEDNEINEEIFIDYLIFEDIEPEAALAGFTPGESYKIKDILYGILLPSGADATRIISHYLTGTPEGLTVEMNKKAKELGMKNTKIKNTSGMDAQGQHTTLSDLLKLIQYAKKNQLFMEIFSEDTYEIDENFTLYNAILLNARNQGFDYLVGSKTGYTDNAKFSLMSIAKKDNLEYIFISHRAEISNESFTAMDDALKVYNYLLNNYRGIILNHEDLIYRTKIKRRRRDIIIDQNPIDAIVSNDFDNDLLKIKYKDFKHLKAPLKKGEVIAQMHVYYNNNLIQTQDVTVHKTIRQGLIFILLKSLFILTLILISLVMMIRTYNIQKYKRRKGGKK